LDFLRRVIRRQVVIGVTVVAAEVIEFVVVAAADVVTGTTWSVEVPAMARRWSIAGQLLALQLGVIAVVLVGVGAVTLAQAQIDFRHTEGGRVLSAAENLAARTLVREALVAPVPQVRREQAAPNADAVSTLSGLSLVMLVDADGIVLADTEDPGRIGKPLVSGRDPADR
jgi:two-component system, CitB family, sensor kinase